MERRKFYRIGVDEGYDGLTFLGRSDRGRDQDLFRPRHNVFRLEIPHFIIRANAGDQLDDFVGDQFRRVALRRAQVSATRFPPRRAA